MQKNVATSWSERQFDRYVREPFWRSLPASLMSILFVLAAAYAVWIASSFWGALNGHGRFTIAFVLVTSPFVLLLAVQQQRYVRDANLPAAVARRISVLTFAMVGWSYALLLLALRLVLASLRQSG